MILLKLLGSSPIIWIGLLLMGGIWFRTHRPRLAWRIIIASTLVLFLFSSPLIANGLAWLVERQTQVLPAAEQSVKTVIILGGGVVPRGGRQRSAEPSGATYARVVQGIEYYRQTTAKKLVLAGAGERPDSATNAEVMFNLAVKLGVDPRQMIMEQQSRNTAEHAHQAQTFLTADDFPLAIVTSALHAPRAGMIFSQVFGANNIVIVPVHFGSSWPSIRWQDLVPSTQAISLSTDVLHEIIGLAWYVIRY